MSSPLQKSLKRFRRWVRPFKNAVDKFLFSTFFPEELMLIQKIREVNLTYCGYPKMENICRAVRKVRQEKVPGLFLEAGCALGGSAILIGFLKPADALFEVYDVFGRIPPPGVEDGPDAHERYEEIVQGQSRGLGEDIYYGYQDKLRHRVIRNMLTLGLDPQRKRIRLIEGLFQETLWPREPVAFAHIDCDWFASVQTCLDRIAPALSPRGRMVIDDYRSYSGCKKAVDFFLGRRPEFKIERLQRSLTLVKT